MLIMDAYECHTHQIMVRKHPQRHSMEAYQHSHLHILIQYELMDILIDKLLKRVKFFVIDQSIRNSLVADDQSQLRQSTVDK